MAFSYGHCTCYSYKQIGNRKRETWYFLKEKMTRTRTPFYTKIWVLVGWHPKFLKSSQIGKQRLNLPGKSSPDWISEVSKFYFSFELVPKSTSFLKQVGFLVPNFHSNFTLKECTKCLVSKSTRVRNELGTSFLNYPNFILSTFIPFFWFLRYTFGFYTIILTSTPFFRLLCHPFVFYALLSAFMPFFHPVFDFYTYFWFLYHHFDFYAILSAFMPSFSASMLIFSFYTFF